MKHGGRPGNLAESERETSSDIIWKRKAKNEKHNQRVDVRRKPWGKGKEESTDGTYA